MKRPKLQAPTALVVGALLAASCSSPAVETTGSTSDDEASASTLSQPSSSATSTATALPSTTPPSTTTTTAAVVAPELRPVELGVDRLVASNAAMLSGQRVGLITNQVSMTGGRHLIDWLADSPDVDLVTIFAAEHGVRGVAGAGELIGDGVDDATGTPIRSLYGSTRQPTAEMLDGLDTIVFDLQDVGARYYTYTATMGLAMQAAATADLRFVVLDRPNPLGRLVEGDLRTDQQTSFISQYPMPSLHGLTAGEMAMMIVGEAWLPGLDGLDLEVVEMAGWAGEPWTSIEPTWIPPSPGLQTADAALTYPATVWFEATSMSYAAGTELAFQAVGAPWLDADAVSSILNARSLPGMTFQAVELAPVDIVDVAIDPRLEGEVFPGVQIIVTDVETFQPSAAGLHMLDVIQASAPTQTVIDRGAVFDLLAGTADVRQQLRSGVSAADIVADWPDVAAEFRARSFAYLLY